MTDPLFWLGLSILLVAVSLTAVLVAALPALQELSRAARSAEKLFDTLNRDLPPTLEAIRLTGVEITNLKADVSQNVQSAGRVVEQLDQSLTSVKQQARQAQVTTRSFVAGVRAAWQVLNRPRVSQPDSDFEPTAQVETAAKLTASELAASETNAPVQLPISESQLTLKQRLEPDYLPDSQQPEPYR